MDSQVFKIVTWLIKDGRDLKAIHNAKDAFRTIAALSCDRGIL
jgi:hypothetical protein